MINVVRRTGHSSYYVEKGMSAMGKTPKQMGLQADSFNRVSGGGMLFTTTAFSSTENQILAFPVWLEVRTR